MPARALPGVCPGSGRIGTVVANSGFCSWCHRYVWLKDGLLLAEHDDTVPEFGDTVRILHCTCKGEIHNGAEATAYRVMSVQEAKLLLASVDTSGRGRCLAWRWQVLHWVHPESHYADVSGSGAE